MVPVADKKEKPKCDVCGKEIKKIHYTHRHAICEGCWEKMKKGSKPIDSTLQGLWWAGEEYE
jgi:hypothetical protein